MSRKANTFIDEEVAQKYEIFERIGSGSYGIVLRARSLTSGRAVAVKKVLGAFRNIADAKRICREVVILNELRIHKNIVTLIEVIEAQNAHDLYLVFEFMEADLHGVIRANVLQDIHVRYITRQLVRATHFMHTAAVLHRDLKPGNLLINSNCVLKICDFGLARATSTVGGGISTSLDEEATPLSSYVATRWYRAPELLLGSRNYSIGVDTWAIGCILAEMLGGHVLFKGSSRIDQLNRICNVLHPKMEDVEILITANFGSDGARNAAHSILRNRRPHKSVTLEGFCKNASTEALDLLSQMLRFLPEDRIPLPMALNHPYLRQFAHEDELLASESIVRIPFDSHPSATVEELKEFLHSQVSLVSASNSATSEDLPLPQALQARTQGRGDGCVTLDDDDDDVEMAK